MNKAEFKPAGYFAELPSGMSYRLWEQGGAEPQGDEVPLYGPEVMDELRRLSQHETALAEWLEKTEWVQKTSKPGELGMHRADVLRDRISALEAENAELRRDAERYRWLRDVSVPPHNFYLSVPVEFADVKYGRKEVDAAIDAALKEAP